MITVPYFLGLGVFSTNYFLRFNFLKRISKKELIPRIVTIKELVGKYIISPPYSKPIKEIKKPKNDANKLKIILKI
jgi:hypothetical protein